MHLGNFSLSVIALYSKLCLLPFLCIFVLYFYQRALQDHTVNRHSNPTNSKIKHRLTSTKQKSDLIWQNIFTSFRTVNRAQFFLLLLSFFFFFLLQGWGRRAGWIKHIEHTQNLRSYQVGEGFYSPNVKFEIKLPQFL